MFVISTISLCREWYNFSETPLTEYTKSHFDAKQFRISALKFHTNERRFILHSFRTNYSRVIFRRLESCQKKQWENIRKNQKLWEAQTFSCSLKKIYEAWIIWSITEHNATYWVVDFKDFSDYLRCLTILKVSQESLRQYKILREGPRMLKNISDSKFEIPWDWFGLYQGLS